MAKPRLPARVRTPAELARTAQVMEQGRAAFAARKTLRDNPYMRLVDMKAWRKGFEEAQHAANQFGLAY